MGLTGCCAACPEAARLSATAVKQVATSWIFACRQQRGAIQNLQQAALDMLHDRPKATMYLRHGILI